MGKKIFMTGATGFLGKNLVPEVLRQDDLDKLFLLSRSPTCPSSLSEYAKDPRLRIIPGDIERTSVLSAADREEIRRETTHIFHIAGLTVFLEEERAQLESMNLNGTRNLLNLFQGCRNIENFLYMSTAYSVNGNTKKNRGLVLEDSLFIPEEFANPYEETKFGAEMLVRRSGLPFSILRPAIFSGNSRTGDTGFDSRAGQGVVYGLMRAASSHPEIGGVDNFFSRLEEHQGNSAPMLNLECRLTGYNHVTKNFMFIDDISSQTMAIFRYMPSGEGKTFHVVSKTDITTEQMLNAMQSSLRVRGFYFAGDPADGDWQIDRTNPVEKIASKIVSRHYAPYFLREEPIWDTTNADAALKASGYERINMTPERFNWLMEMYSSRELGVIVRKFAAQKEERKKSLGIIKPSIDGEETEPKKEYMQYIKQFGENTMAYSALQPGIKLYHIPRTGIIPFAVVPPADKTNEKSEKFRIRLRERVENETGINIPLEERTTTHVLSDPICDPKNLEELLVGFTRNHPEACFWQVSEKTAEILKKLGYRANEFGTETTIVLPGYNFSGRKKQGFRRASNRAIAEGIIIKEENRDSFNWDEARSISSDWVNYKNQTTPEAAENELAFLARPMEYHAEEDTRIFSARNKGKLEGFIIYTPLYRQGQIFGFYADILRHTNNQDYSVCDAINVHAIQKFQSEKFEALALGISPFARIEETDFADPIIHEIFRKTQTDELANAVYNFKGVAQHKGNYLGKITPVYFCTREDIPLEQMVGLFRACKAF